MKVSEVYPSNFIAAGDLDGREVTLTIDRIADKNTVVREDKSKIDKAVLYFSGTEKGLVLGKTNARAIRILHGNDMARWEGKKITLYPTTTDMARAAAEKAGCIILSGTGKMAVVPCIRVKVPASLGEAAELGKQKTSNAQRPTSNEGNADTEVEW